MLGGSCCLEGWDNEHGVGAGEGGSLGLHPRNDYPYAFHIVHLELFEHSLTKHSSLLSSCWAQGRLGRNWECVCVLLFVDSIIPHVSPISLS